MGTEGVGGWDEGETGVEKGWGRQGDRGSLPVSLVHSECMSPPLLIASATFLRPLQFVAFHV